MQLEINDKLEVRAVYDCGSNITVINKRTLMKLASASDHLYEIKKPNSFKSVVGNFKCGERATLLVKIGSIRKKVDFYVIDNPKFRHEAIIGLDCIKAFRLNQTDKLEVFQREKKKRKKRRKKRKKKSKKTFNLLADANEKTELIEINLIESRLTDDELDEALKSQKFDVEGEGKREEILKMLNERKSVFARSKFHVSQYAGAQADIKLIDEKIVSMRPYKTSLSDEREIENQVKLLLENDLIEETDSPYASPVTLVNKRGEGKSRLCVDMRNLNKLVVPETHPLLRFEDILDRLRGCTYFTTVDINSAFWTVKLKRKARKRTAFVTNRYHFQWKVLPFGLKTSPAVFQRILASILRKAGLSDFAVNYIDDVLVFSKTYEEHMRHVMLVLKALEEASMRVKLSKCQFFRSEVVYLGHKISKNQSQPMNDNLRAIREFPRPKNRKAVRQILGKINHYRKYVPNCTQKLRPLHDLLKKHARFSWTERCESAFREVKRILAERPVLATFNERAECVIFSDASAEGCGAVLKQRQDDGELKPVAYFSCKISKAQFKRGAVYAECLAIYKAIRFWHYYLHNTKFTVFSDHKPLENLRIQAAPDTPLGDLANKLAQYNFVVRHLAGPLNFEADSLSRNPILLEFDDEEIFATVNLVELSEIVDSHDRITEEEAERKKLIRDECVLVRKKNGVKRIYLKKEMARRVVGLAHEKFGHIGATAMKRKLRPRFYFKRFEKTIDNYCDACRTCRKNKSRQKKLIGLMSELGPSRRPLSIISIDTVGGLTGRGAKRKYLHLATDHATRFCWYRASATQKADDFVKLIRQTGNPKEIDIVLLDQYSGQDSRELKRFMKENDILPIYTPVDHAESNGRIERIGQTIVNRLRCRVNEPGETRRWSSLIGSVVKQYNNTMHSATGFPPALLLNGKVEIPVSPREPPVDLDKARATAYENSRKHHDQNKKRVDRRRAKHEFRVGDRVVVKLTSDLNRKKLDELRSGPFEIVRIISDSVFELNTGKKKRINNVFHANALRPI